MIIENVPSDFLLLKECVFEFSDDLRFIYMHSGSRCWKGFSHNIAAFDIIYNKLIILSPDETVTALLIEFNDFFTDTYRPNGHIINYNTLLFSFNSSSTDDNTAALLILVELNFSKNSYSLLDHKLIRDCEAASLVKNDNKLLLLHEFSAADDPDGLIKFLGYYTFFLQDDNKISDLQGDRVIFDYNYDNAGSLSFWHVHDNKLWFFRQKRTGPIHHHISYFDLKEKRPKFTPFDFFQGLDEFMFQWSGKYLYRYSIASGDFSFLDLESLHWSINYQRNLLTYQNFEIADVNLMSFWQSNAFYWSTFSFENDFKSALFVDTTKKQLVKIPLKEPFRLLDIAWANVLNYGLLDEFNKKGVTIYSKVF